MRPRLFWQILSLEVRTRMSYRVDFWLNAVAGFLVELAVVWFLWQAVFHESGRQFIGGRTFEDTVVYYLCAILIGKLVRGQDWEAAISQDIYTGGLNRYLLFPAHYLPFKYAQRMGALGPGVLQFVFFDLPVRVFLGELGPLEWVRGMGLALGWCAVFAALGRLLWWRGRLQYTGIGI